jgi:hypothetical protein
MEEALRDEQATEAVVVPDAVDVPAAKPKRTKVAIVGFASSSRDQAPYGDESFEIWSLNHAYSHVPRWDRWYEIHPRAHFQKDLMRDGLAQDGQRHVGWLAQEPAGGRPIYCQEHYDDIPASVRWPRAEINEWLRKNGGLGPDDLALGFHAEDYYTSTPGQMIAQAIWEGFEEIHLYGVDMLQAEEYYYQRSGCEYYVGFARGRGIRVYVPPTSALCKANYVYGYSEPATDIKHIQPYVDHLNSKVQESELNKNKAASAAATIDGGLQMARLLLELADKGGLERDAKGELLKGEDGQPRRHPCTLEDIVGEAKRQMVILEPKLREAQNTVIAMDGQMAGFRCSSAWAEHYARGGTLQ